VADAVLFATSRSLLWLPAAHAVAKLMNMRSGKGGRLDIIIEDRRLRFGRQAPASAIRASPRPRGHPRDSLSESVVDLV
jgi:hypothetical protein